MKKAAAALLLVGILPGMADYVVDVDLGILPVGNTFLVGTTAATNNPSPPPPTIGGKNNSLYVKDESDTPLVVDGDIQTWGNEIVYRFELAGPSFVTITKNSIQGDADFFLLDGLATSVDGFTGKLSSTRGLDLAFLDGPVGESSEFIPLTPGVYYLTAENYDGLDSNLTPGNATFDVTLNVREASAIDLALDIGPIAAAGSPLNLNTFGSRFNTVLAIYDLFGTLLFENDDAGGGLQSQISLPAGLPADFYYAVIAGNGTTFGPGFAVSSGGAVGDWTLNFPLGPVLDPGQLTGTTDASSPGIETQYIIFSIASRPVNPIALGVLANQDQPFFVDTTGSGFDTQLAMFDSEGFWLAFNDDIDFSVRNFQSLLDFPDGLLAGNYYFSLAGYPHDYGDGFFVASAGGAEGGAYQLNHPLGFQSGALNSNQSLWFSFEIAALPVIEIGAIGFNSATNQFTISWNTSVPGPYRIWAGNASDLAALQSAPDNILPFEAATGVTSPATFTVPAALLGESHVFLQVTD